MNSDDFEKQLKRQELRRIPPGWRDSILTAAQNARVVEKEKTSKPFATDSVARSEGESAGVRGWLNFSWREWLWPCPEAWAGLAAVWLVVLVLNIAPAPETPMARNVTPAELQFQIAEQRREIARLLDLPPASPPAAHPVTPPGPRSEGVAPSKA